MARWDGGLNTGEDRGSGDGMTGVDAVLAVLAVLVASVASVACLRLARALPVARCPLPAVVACACVRACERQSGMFHRDPSKA